MSKENPSAVTAPATATAYVPRPDPPSPLKLRRIRNGIRLNDLSIETGIDAGKLSYIERGRRPPTPTEQRAIFSALRRIERRS